MEKFFIKNEKDMSGSLVTFSLLYYINLIMIKNLIHPFFFTYQTCMFLQLALPLNRKITTKSKSGLSLFAVAD